MLCFYQDKSCCLDPNCLIKHNFTVCFACHCFMPLYMISLFTKTGMSFGWRNPWICKYTLGEAPSFVNPLSTHHKYVVLYRGCNTSIFILSLDVYLLVYWDWGVFPLCTSIAVGHTYLFAKRTIIICTVLGILLSEILCVLQTHCEFWVYSCCWELK